MVPDCNVAFSCKLCSDKRYHRPCLAFRNDDWQFATPSSRQPLETFFPY
uniref:Uncharacterized protein n=1 Tax=Arundo donax TaxID=35708 RepID=A0A0A9H8N4_ARUDO